MSVDEDVRSAIDSSFGDGGRPVPAEELVKRGRRALLRKRTGTVAATTAVVVVLAGGAVLASDRDVEGGAAPASGRATAAPSPAEPSPTENPTPSQSAPSQDGWPGTPDDHLVRFAAGSETLRPRPGVTIVRQRGHVQVGASFAGPSDRTAAAKVRRADGEVLYVIARSTPGGPGQYIAVRQRDGGPTLPAFLHLARQRYAEGGGGLL